MADLDSFVIARASSQIADDFALSLLENEVFFSLDPDFAAGRSGSVRLASQHAIRFDFAEIAGKKLALFYTTKSDARLIDPVAGISFGEALRWVATAGSVDGLLLQSSGAAWIGLDMEAIRSAIARFE